VFKQDEPCGDWSQRLERKDTGYSRLEKSCEGSQCPPRAVAMMMMMMICLNINTNIPNLRDHVQ
jgi:hypothetical protein